MGERREVTAVLTDNKVHFQAVSRNCTLIDIDYPPPLGEGNGYTSLEIFLISLATCSGTSVTALLKRMGKSITGLKVHAIGTRKDQHPTSFETIHLNFEISGDTDDLSVQKAIKTSEEMFCPVWAMIKGNVQVTTGFSITEQVLETE